MLLYAVLHPWVLLGFKKGRGGVGSAMGGWRWWFGEKKGKKTEERDEAWVFDGS